MAVVRFGGQTEALVENDENRNKDIIDNKSSNYPVKQIRSKYKKQPRRIKKWNTPGNISADLTRTPIILGKSLASASRK